MSEVKTPIAVAIHATTGGSLYEKMLYTPEEVQLVREGTHPDICEEDRVIVVHADLTTEDFT